MRYQKVCVEVVVRFSAEGGMRPLEICWEDGRTFSVERLKYREQAPARVSAILPVRYTCMIGGRERRLYFEPEQERWFVEVPVV